MTDAALPAPAPQEPRPAPFDPAVYLTKVGGSDYLPVPARILWLRTLHPDAVLETQAVSIGDTEAIFRCAVTLPSGGKATGYGSETAGDFRDFIEKAETKAVGRALAALGFGTQFCDDFAHGVVDTPVGKPAGRKAAERPWGAPKPAAGAKVQDLDGPISDAQLKALDGIADRLKMSTAELEQASKVRYEGKAPGALSMRQGRDFVAWLQAQKGKP